MPDSADTLSPAEISAANPGGIPQAVDMPGGNIVDLVREQEAADKRNRAAVISGEQKLLRGDPNSKDPELRLGQIGLQGLLAQKELRQSEDYRQRQERMLKAEGADIEELRRGAWNADAELEKRKTGLWDQFGSPGFIIAMLGSAFTATPMNSALNSGAAAMNAINAGDMKSYEKAFEAWKDNTKLTMDRLKLEQDQFNQFDKLRTTNMAEWQNQMKMALLRFNDQRKAMLLEHGYFEELDSAIAAQAKSRENLELSYNAILQNEARRRMVMEDPRAKNGDPKAIFELTNEAERQISEAKRAGLGLTLSKLETEAVVAKADELMKMDKTLTRSDAIAQATQLVKPSFAAGGALEALPNGDVKPPPGMPQDRFDDLARIWKRTGYMPPLGLGGAVVREGIVAHGTFLAKQAGQTPEEMTMGWSVNKSNVTALNKLEQQRAAVESFSNTEVANGEVLADLAQRIDATGVPVIERWQRAGRQAIQGDPDVTMFNSQIVAYRNGVARIITNPNLTGVLSVRAMHEAQSFAEGNMTAKQIRMVTELFKDDFARRKKPLEDEIKRIEGVLAGNPDVESGTTMKTTAPQSNSTNDGWGQVKVK